MPSPLPWWRFFPKDWLSSSGVRRMTLAARSLYFDLLCLQWEDGIIDDSDERKLARALAVDLRLFRRLWPEVASHFEPCPGGVRNRRMAEDREAAFAYAAQQAANGRRKGAKPQAAEAIPGLTNTKLRDISGIDDPQKMHPSNGELSRRQVQTAKPSLNGKEATAQPNGSDGSALQKSPPVLSSKEGGKPPTTNSFEQFRSALPAEYTNHPGLNEALLEWRLIIDKRSKATVHPASVAAAVKAWKAHPPAWLAEGLAIAIAGANRTVHPKRPPEPAHQQAAASNRTRGLSAFHAAEAKKAAASA